MDSTLTTDETTEKKTRKEAERRNFDKNSILTTLVNTPGNYSDANSEYKGLGLRVSPLLKAVWHYRPRDADGKQVRVKPLPVDLSDDADGVTVFNLVQARARFKEDKKNAKLSKNQLADLKRKNLTLNDVFEEFLENRRTKGSEELAAATKATHTRSYNNIKALAGDWPLRDTKAGKWSDLLQKFTPTRANQIKNFISGVYDYLFMRDELDINPITKVTKSRVIKKTEARMVAVKVMDLPTFWGRLENIRQPGRHVTTVTLLTGFRSSAVRMMRWSQLDFELGAYFVQKGQPGWKGFQGVVPLSDAVLDILRARYDDPMRDSEWIFPARSEGTKFPYLSSMRGTVEKCSEGFEHRLAPHDLRRSFSSFANIVMGNELKKIGALMTHKWGVDAEKRVITRQQITLRYIQSEFAPLRHATNRLSQFILELAGAAPLSAETKALMEKEGHDASHLVLPELSDDEDPTNEE
ncbi:hypothetical protein BLA23254_06062 [Burkholderia lata]|uniref:Tyr recombinase domain-containing protein n=1 Tax=Burkholderia lata (strain ATCC 17760 / DSM 23089 / LMG 22485 / NCIMB 9086 / R18194 / 383) TaxID=482957 RepID=A0A6P2R6B2_BURL3|nr:site-specific integrase [Burkholderia lata]VWC25925.1 hypothetical protein BLA23254_06062 [Burkholderia lata]